MTAGQQAMLAEEKWLRRSRGVLQLPFDLSKSSSPPPVSHLSTASIRTRTAKETAKGDAGDLVYYASHTQYLHTYTPLTGKTLTYYY